MQIDYVSDLHVNHYVGHHNNLVKNELKTKKWAEELFQTKSKYSHALIIAGDFSEWNRQSLWILEEARQHYQQVFFVTGNHEYYLLSKTTNRKYIESVNRQQELVMGAEKIAGVSPLVRRVIDYEGFTIAGDCMWYLPKTEDDWDFYFDNSNDSSLIFSLQHRGRDLASFLHQESMNWYKTLEGKKIDLMVSHVPPIHPTISNDKKNGVYHTPVPFYAAKKWICGHHHLRTTFKADEIQFYMNAIGYPREFNQKEIATLILE